MNSAGFGATPSRLVAPGPGGQNAPMRPTDLESRPRLSLFAPLAGFVVIAALLQFLLILNPGYYSHDELQWGALGDVAPGASLPWVSWLDWRVFQFRPLTFNLWLLLSHCLFGSPVAFHALWVALGIGNGLLLLRLMQRLGVGVAPALLFALGFVLGPFAAYTHGWVGTLADLLWVGFGLLLAQVLLWAGDDPTRRWPARALAFALTALALLSKESAIVLPTLVALAWLLSGRRRILRDAAICSALPVLAYLALRLHIILFAPRSSGAYGWSLLSIPKQWLTYQLFPLMPSIPEIHIMLTRSSRHWLSVGLFWLILASLVVRANVRAGVLFVLGGALALGPVLLLEAPSNHYGYGFAAVSMLALALAWAGLGGIGRALAVLFVLIGAWHGINIQRELRHDGELQARFSPALAQAIVAAERLPVRVRIPEDHGWVYQRASHDLQSYRGVAIGDRVQLVRGDEAADYRVEPDGGLKKIP